MPEIVFVEGSEEHERSRRFATGASVFVRPKSGRCVLAERVPWKAVRLSGAAGGKWYCRVMKVPEGSEITFDAYRNTYGGAGLRFFEQEECIDCIVDPRVPVIRITGPSCCGRASFVEGPLRIVRIARLAGKARMPWLFSCGAPGVSPDARTHVFGNLWIGAGFPLYFRYCSVCGRYRALEDASPVDRRGMLGDWIGSFAAMIAAAGRFPEEELPGAVLLMMRAIAGMPDYGKHGFAYVWLQETLGKSVREIPESLERIAELADRPVPAFVAGLESGYVFSENAAWHAAGYIILPALAAATNSCAEYRALRNAVRRKARRSAAGLQTVWKKALEYVRVAAKVLRNRARCVP